MSDNTTGGRRRSNQHRPHGTPKIRPTASADPHFQLHADLSDLLASELHAIPNPGLDISVLESFCHQFSPRGIERGITRWQIRLPTLIWNDATLEGNLFTLPDVTTVIDGGSPKGYTDHDLDQIIALTHAAELVTALSQHSPQEPSNTLSSDLNRLITASELIEPGVLRGEGTLSGHVGVNVFGTTFWPTEAGKKLRQAFNDSLEQAATINHPVARAVAWAALATYHQFYSNGNKRTARYVMNTVLLSHGYDAILTPAARHDDYNQSLADMYHSHTLTGHALFLASLYDDSHNTPGT